MDEEREEYIDIEYAEIATGDLPKVARSTLYQLCKDLGHDATKVTAINITGHEVSISYIHQVD